LIAPSKKSQNALPKRLAVQRNREKIRAEKYKFHLHINQRPHCVVRGLIDPGVESSATEYQVDYALIISAKALRQLTNIIIAIGLPSCSRCLLNPRIGLIGTRMLTVIKG
jgi:hypothetical protein